MNHLDRGSWSLRQSIPTVIATDQHSRRINRRCSLPPATIIHLRRELSTTSTYQNARMRMSRGALQSIWTLSTAQPVSQVCRQSAPAARKFVGWEIEGMVIWTSTALSDGDPELPRATVWPAHSLIRGWRLSSATDLSLPRHCRAQRPLCHDKCKSQP